jgi:hypothetical protein
MLSKHGIKNIASLQWFKAHIMTLEKSIKTNVFKSVSGNKMLSLQL